MSTASLRLSVPQIGGEVEWVSVHLRGLFSGDVRDANATNPDLVGTQTAANNALARLDLRGYAASRNQVWPESTRGARRLSAWIRHGLLPLPEVATRAEMAPGSTEDHRRFIDELWWQEYARHLYGRLGTLTALPLRYAPPERQESSSKSEPDEVWDPQMLCIKEARQELEQEGFLVNQTRMWLASHWTVRHGVPWRVGEDLFFRHLLDGSRAANRLGWQWTVGAGTGKVYGFSRWQVNKRAPGLCAHCPLQDKCPIEEWPVIQGLASHGGDPRLRFDFLVNKTAGPDTVVRNARPAAVWLTAESLGDNDPAYRSHPDLPVIFIWDAALLTKLRLAGHRLVYLTQRLSEIASQRELHIWRGAPDEVIGASQVATTFAPVPGWRRITRDVDLAEVHPWPWLVRPTERTVASYTAWRKAVSEPSRP
jgi:deoxyribodipyrimidine photo-lyase